MRVPVIILAVVTLIAASVFSVAILSAGGQAGARGQAPAAAGRGQPPAGPAIPRAADGKPDLSGIWQVLDNSLDGSIEPHAASYGVRAGQGAIVDPPDGKIPYLPAALAKRQANYKNRAKDPVAYCFKPGVPRITYMPFPFQIIQGKDTILMASEFASASRTIRMNTREKSPTDAWMGWSIGRWDGDTLVIDVTDQIDQTWFDRAGDFHSEALRVVERYTSIDRNTISYEATMEDPKVFTRPWKISMPLYRHVEKNAQLMEYKCVEFVEELMYGHLRKKPSNQ